jgi:hypothetical protein
VVHKLSAPGTLKLFYLSGYSPELNPDEWGMEERQARPHRQDRRHQQGRPQIKTKATNVLRRLQKMPHLVRGVFHDPNLAYITA